MAAEGWWTTWSDDTDAPHIARLDVPGNEALEADRRAGVHRRPTREELQRGIEWTTTHPEWEAEVHREFEEEFGIPFEVPSENSPAPAPAAGPFWYLDSHTGAIVQATRADDLGGDGPRTWWRLILRSDDSDSGRAAAEQEVEHSLDAGEPAISVPSDFPFRPPMEQIDLAREAIDALYREPTTGDPGGIFGPQILELQRQWGMSPPLTGYPSQPGSTGGDFPILPARPPRYLDRRRHGPRSEAAPAVGLRRVASGEESVESNWLDMMERADKGIPSQQEGDISVPGFNPFDPGAGYPLRRLPPLPPSRIPQVPPGWLGRPQWGSVALGIGPTLGSPVSTLATPPRMHRGGIVPASGPYTLQAGEAVLPAAAVARIAQGAPAAPEGSGVHPFNQGSWPTEEEQARRLEEIRRQLERMKRENPALYRRLPLLHELLEPPTEPVPTPEILRERDQPPRVPAPGMPMGQVPRSIAATVGPVIVEWFRRRTIGEPGELMLGEMPIGPGGLARRTPAPPLHRMSLKRALETLGVPIEPSAKGRTVRGSISGIGLARPASLQRPVTERIPGGPEYLHETARQAYWARAKELHPDRGGSAEAMQRLNEAWEVVERHVKYGVR